METVEQLLVRYGVALSRQLKEDIKSKPTTRFGSSNASGKLEKSIRFEVTDGKLEISGWDYIYYVEKGRGKTKKKGDKPLKEIIEQWIIDKGIISDISTKSLAFLIARKIHREGTEIYKQGGSNLLEDIITDSMLGQIKSDLILLFSENVISKMRSAITGKSI